jgi:hypothetical protein
MPFRQAVGQAHQPVAFEGGFLGQATPPALAYAPAGMDHLVARLKSRRAARLDHPDTVDSGDERPGANHRRFIGDGQSILVIQRGIGDGNAHVCLGQQFFVKRAYACLEIAVSFGKQETIKHVHSFIWKNY